MKTEMRMPQMGESISEATILKWLKKVGDSVEKDEIILEISTDKVDSEIPAPATGTLVEIIAQEGETLDVLSVIAVIDSEGTGAKPAKTKPEAKKAPEAPQEVEEQPIPQAPVGDRSYSPLVLRLAKQYGISDGELSEVQGSGHKERVTKEDVLRYLGARESGSSSPNTQREKSPVASAPRPQYGPDGRKVEPMNNMRKLIAEHMIRSKQTSAHVYSMAEVDVTAISAWRKKQQAAFQAREGFKLSFTPFFLEAVVRALFEHPRINASVEGDTLVLKQEINLGCAVALGSGGTEGLIVPVIKDAEKLSFVGLARELQELVKKARSKKLSPDDVQGGTFTLTNPGIFGNIMGCPVINQPQLGILGIGAIKKRPVVINDAIAIREMCILTLSYDHRVIDGALSGHFLSSITKYLEGWDQKRSI